ncbi:hypothetical protein TNCV_1896921 [Trichonephila clavipes]|nr:hypothetical protein TNCV_1896921 [Trichonephila clavipes]
MKIWHNITHLTRAIFNLPDALGIVAPPPIISRAPPPLPSVLILPVLVREGLSHNSLTFPFLCLFNGKSFHYPTPMDPPCPGLATDSPEIRERITCAANNFDNAMLSRVRLELDYHSDLYRVPKTRHHVFSLLPGRDFEKRALKPFWSDLEKNLRQGVGYNRNLPHNTEQQLLETPSYLELCALLEIEQQRRCWSVVCRPQHVDSRTEWIQFCVMYHERRYKEKLPIQTEATTVTIHFLSKYTDQVR